MRELLCSWEEKHKEEKAANLASCLFVDFRSCVVEYFVGAFYLEGRPMALRRRRTEESQGNKRKSGWEWGWVVRQSGGRFTREGKEAQTG